MASRTSERRRSVSALAPAAVILAARADRNHAHRIAQAEFSSSIVAPAVEKAWARLFDRNDLPGSRRRLALAILAIVTHYGRAGSAAALTHFRNERRAQGVGGKPPRLHVAPAPTLEQVEAVVDRVIPPHGLTPSPSAPPNAVAPSSPALPDVKPTPETAPDSTAEQKAQDALVSETERMVLDQSRETLIGAVQDDREARAWARLTEPGACSFCRLLATRGAVYKTEETANFRAHVKQPNGSGGTCRCHVEPAFGEYEMTAQARQDLADYERLADEFGHSGRDILIAWRQHVEGREVTGPLTKPYTRG